MGPLFRAHPVQIPIMDSEVEGDLEDRKALDRGEIIITEMISIEGDEGKY